MKKILFAAVLFCSITAFANAPIISQKVLNAFNKTFQNAKEVSWTELAGSYEVKFLDADIRMRVVYDEAGNIINTIRYYYEDKLPVLILTKVKSKYEGKKIFGVTETSSDEGMRYHIILEDSKSWTTVIADPSGSMYVDKKIRKS
jgi:hypothetical protein